jgi:hypothetical protein
MYVFKGKDRKQTHLNTEPILDYLILASEPAESRGFKTGPSFTYINRYIAKRRLLRKIRMAKHHEAC